VIGDLEEGAHAASVAQRARDVESPGVGALQRADRGRAGVLVLGDEVPAVVEVAVAGGQLAAAIGIKAFQHPAVQVIVAELDPAVEQGRRPGQRKGIGAHLNQPVLGIPEVLPHTVLNHIAVGIVLKALHAAGDLRGALLALEEIAAPAGALFVREDVERAPPRVRIQRVVVVGDEGFVGPELTPT